MAPMTRATAAAAASLLVAIVAPFLPASAEDAPNPDGPAAAIAKAARPHHVYLAGTLRVSRPWIDLASGPAPQRAYLTVENRGTAPDTLTAASIDGAPAVQLVQGNGAPADGLVVPAKGELLLQEGGPHLETTGLGKPAQPGVLIGGTLRFSRAGSMHLSFSTDRGETEQDDQTTPTAIDKPAQLQQ